MGELRYRLLKQSKVSERVTFVARGWLVVFSRHYLLAEKRQSVPPLIGADISTRIRIRSVCSLKLKKVMKKLALWCLRTVC
jgi:hypothetical protein